MIPEELWRRVPGLNLNEAGDIHQDPRYMAMSRAFLPLYDLTTWLPDGLEPFRHALPTDTEDEQAYFDRVRREYPRLADDIGPARQTRLDLSYFKQLGLGRVRQSIEY